MSDVTHNAIAFAAPVSQPTHTPCVRCGAPCGLYSCAYCTPECEAAAALLVERDPAAVLADACFSAFWTAVADRKAKIEADAAEAAARVEAAMARCA